MILSKATATALIGRTTNILQCISRAFYNSSQQQNRLNVIADQSYDPEVIKYFQDSGIMFENWLSAARVLPHVPAFTQFMVAFDRYFEDHHLSFDYYLSTSGIQVASTFAEIYGRSTGNDFKAGNVYMDRPMTLGTFAISGGVGVFTEGITLTPSANAHSYSGLRAGQNLVNLSVSPVGYISSGISVGVSGLSTDSSTVLMENVAVPGVTVNKFRVIIGINLVAGPSGQAFTVLAQNATTPPQ